MFSRPSRSEVKKTCLPSRERTGSFSSESPDVSWKRWAGLARSERKILAWPGEPTTET